MTFGGKCECFNLPFLRHILNNAHKSHAQTDVTFFSSVLYSSFAIHCSHIAKISL